MKKFRFTIALLAVLMLVALGSWTWYFLTAQKNTVLRRGNIRIVPRQTRPLPPQRAATAAERKAASIAIRAQLDAFKKDDYKRAMIYQSKGLRKNFGTPEKFRAMMRFNYPQFAQYQKVEFGKSLAQGEGAETSLIMPISLTGTDGIEVQATYVMVKEDGQYRVASVLGGNAPGAPQEDQRDPFSDFNAPPLET